MAGAWDSKLKMLATIVPQDMTSWLLAGAKFEGEVSPHLPSRNIDADILYNITLNQRQCLLHVEFQRGSEAEMARRVWEYNVLATCKHEVLVYSFLIYLKKGVTIATSPYEWITDDGISIHRFHFQVIKLWEIPFEELLNVGLKGLLPLLPLTYGGKRRDVVEQAINRLYSIDDKINHNLLVLTYGIASLAFESEGDRAWLRRRFSMLKDILSESWAFQEIMQEGWDQGHEKGMKEGRLEGRLEGLKQLLFMFISNRFPDLLALAQEKVQTINDGDVLQNLIFKVGTTANAEEVRHYLTEVIPGKEQ